MIETTDVYFLNGIKLENGSQVKIAISQENSSHYLTFNPESFDNHPFFSSMKCELSMQPKKHLNGLPAYTDNDLANKILSENGASIDEDTGNLCRVSRLIDKLVREERELLHAVAKSLDKNKKTRIRSHDLEYLANLYSDHNVTSPEFLKALNVACKQDDSYHSGYLLNSRYIKLKVGWFIPREV